MFQEIVSVRHEIPFLSLKKLYFAVLHSGHTTSYCSRVYQRGDFHWTFFVAIVPQKSLKWKNTNLHVRPSQLTMPDWRYLLIRTLSVLLLYKTCQVRGANYLLQTAKTPDDSLNESLFVQQLNQSYMRKGRKPNGYWHLSPSGHILCEKSQKIKRTSNLRGFASVVPHYNATFNWRHIARVKLMTRYKSFMRINNSFSSPFSNLQSFLLWSFLRRRKIINITDKKISN